jgi:hypothetical protein
MAVFSATGVPRANHIDAGVGNVDLRARDIRLGPRAHLEEAARGTEVELRALQGLLVHADEPLGEVDVRVLLLHGLRDDLALELDVFERHVGLLARGLRGGGVLAEIEDQLRQDDLRAQRLSEVTGDGRRDGRPRARAEDHRVAAGGADRARQLGQQRCERLVDPILRGRVVVEPGQDVRLIFERDRDGFVDADRALREHVARRRRCAHRIGGVTDGGRAEKEENRDQDPSHVHTPSSARTVAVHFPPAR